MKVILTAILLYSSFFQTTGKYRNINASKVTSSDTTRHEKFILSILNDYEKSGQWMFIQIDSCDTIYPSIVQPSELYRIFSETNNNLDKKQFIWLIFEALKHDETIARCPSQAIVYGFKNATAIKGIKVDRKVYKKLNQENENALLLKYFNADKTFKTKYKSIFYEVVASCYKRNIRVITAKDGKSKFEVYK